MQEIADKSDDTGGTTGQLPASEYNDHKNEMQTAVEYSGQTLSISKENQFAQALFINGVSASSMTDSGSANLIQLSPVSGSTGLQVAESYSALNGALFRFNKAVTNTSTTVTVNLGQTGTELGAKSLKLLDGTDPNIGDVEGECLIRYDGTNFELISSTAVLENIAHPVGSVYIQFPGDADPATLDYPGTWSNVSSELAGDFIRFEGGNASTFESGQQSDAMQRITGSMDFGAGAIGTASGAQWSAGEGTGPFTTATGGYICDGSQEVEACAGFTYDNADSISPNTAKTNDEETRAVNRTVRKWRRTA